MFFKELDRTRVKSFVRPITNQLYIILSRVFNLAKTDLVATQI